MAAKGGVLRVCVAKARLPRLGYRGWVAEGRLQVIAYLKVGLGCMRRPTPYSATMKKCMTNREGLGARPDSREMGPDE